MVNNKSVHIYDPYVQRRSVDQFKAQLTVKALYEFHVELSWFSRDLVPEVRSEIAEAP